MTPLASAHTKLMLAVVAHRPRELRADNSYDALAALALQIDAVTLEFRDYLKALTEQAAQHIPLAGRLDDVVEAYMSDMASEIRGALLKALESEIEDRREQPESMMVAK